MLGKWVLPLVVLAALQAGVRAGDEEIMALRGNAPEGAAGVNQFRSAPEAAAARLPLDNVGWKNHCATVPMLVAGGSVDMHYGNAAGGFGMAPSLTGEREANGELSFLEMMVKGFAGE